MQHCTSRLQVVFLRGVCKGERFVFVRSRRREAAVAADSTLLIMAREGRERRREREREDNCPRFEGWSVKLQEVGRGG